MEQALPRRTDHAAQTRGNGKHVSAEGGTVGAAGTRRASKRAVGDGHVGVLVAATRPRPSDAAPPSACVGTRTNGGVTARTASAAGWGAKKQAA